MTWQHFDGCAQTIAKLSEHLMGRPRTSRRNGLQRAWPRGQWCLRWHQPGSGPSPLFSWPTAWRAEVSLGRLWCCTSGWDSKTVSSEYPRSQRCWFLRIGQHGVVSQPWRPAHLSKGPSAHRSTRGCDEAASTSFRNWSWLILAECDWWAQGR